MHGYLLLTEEADLWYILPGGGTLPERLHAGTADGYYIVCKANLQADFKKYFTKICLRELRFPGKRRRNMVNYSVFPTPYTVGPAAYRKVPEICRIYGTKAVVLGGHTAIARAKEKLTEAVAGTEIEILDWVVYGTECSREAAARAEAQPAVRDADMIFAVGGGKAVDTCKLVSLDLNKPLFSFPTIVSNCAAASALSIVYHEDHSFAEFQHMEEGAKHVFIDTEICARAPENFLWAGIGDTCAKYYEVSISARGEKLPHYLETGVHLSRLCRDALAETGAEALRENREGIPGDAFEQAALTIIVTTGLVSMLVAKEHNMDYNGGAAHAFFYGLCGKPGFEEDHLHGVVVAFGVLILLLMDGRPEEAEQLAAFYRTVGLPTRLSEIGVTVADVQAYAETMTRDEDLEHYPYRVTAEMITDAAARLDT